MSLLAACRIVDIPDDLSWALFAYSGAASAAGQVYTGAVLCTPDGRWPAPAAEERIMAALRCVRHDSPTPWLSQDTVQLGKFLQFRGAQQCVVRQMCTAPEVKLNYSHVAAGWQESRCGSCSEWTIAAAKACPWVCQKKMLRPILLGSPWL